MGEERFDGGGDGGGKFLEDFCGVGFAERKGAGGGLNEPARSLARVAAEALAQRERVDGEGQAVDERVPAVGFALLNRGEVTLDETVVAQRAETLQLTVAHAAAGGRETLVERFVGQLAVIGDEFAEFVARGVIESALDGGQFERLQNFGVIILQEILQAGSRGDLPEWERICGAREGRQTFRRAKLLDQRLEVTEEFRRYRRELCLVQHDLRPNIYPRLSRFNAAPLHVRMPAVKMPASGLIACMRRIFMAILLSNPPPSIPR